MQARPSVRPPAAGVARDSPLSKPPERAILTAKPPGIWEMSNEHSEVMTMDAKGFVVPPGGGAVLSMAPGRFAALKLLGGETGDSIMLFEETAPVGTDTTFHLHRDSDEVAYVLSGEFTFKIGEEVTVGGQGTCAFMPRGVPHAWKNTGADTGRVLFLYTPAGAGGFFEERLGRPAGSINGEEANEIRRRHGWEIVGPPPF